MIKKLDPLLIQKIAAGEVIESPVSIVKELIENSLDANATKIEVILSNGGKNLIVIKDNGDGMHKDDLSICYQRHATSKINNENDLYAISTLGFRGEALASICAVSHFSILSKQKESEIGNAIFVTEEKLIDTKELSLNQGTTMIVKDLFYNLPVRLNFMKQRSYELRKIIDLVKSYALINTEIHFVLVEINNTKINNLIKEKEFLLIDDIKYSSNEIIFNSPSSKTLIDKVAGIFGFNIAKELIEISSDDSTVFVDGVISKPTLYRSSKANVFTYVNNRLVESKVINNAIRDAYSKILSNKFPFAILNLTVPKSFVDVNVHPNKLTINFVDDKKVYFSVFNSIKNTLNTHSLIPGVNANSFKSENKDHVQKNNNASFFKISNNNHDDVKSSVSQKDLNSNLADSIKPQDFNINTHNTNTYFNNSRQVSQKSLIKENKSNENNYEFSKKNEFEKNLTLTNNYDEYKENQLENDFILLGQFANSYVIIQKNKKLLILDQHVIEERINYEKFTSLYHGKGISNQTLLQPLILNLQPEDIILIKENKELFLSVGIDIDVMDERSIIVRSLPYILKKQSDDSIIYEIIDYLKKNSKSLNAVEHIKDEMIKQISCKASIKQGQPLTDTYMNRIVKELFTTKNPYVCPHGRPVIVEITLNELNKMFKRK